MCRNVTVKPDTVSCWQISLASVQHLCEPTASLHACCDLMLPTTSLPDRLCLLPHCLCSTARAGQPLCPCADGDYSVPEAPNSFNQMVRVALI